MRGLISEWSFNASMESESLAWGSTAPMLTSKATSNLNSRSSRKSETVFSRRSEELLHSSKSMTSESKRVSMLTIFPECTDVFRLASNWFVIEVVAAVKALLVAIDVVSRATCFSKLVALLSVIKSSNCLMRLLMESEPGGRNNRISWLCKKAHVKLN